MFFTMTPEMAKKFADLQKKNKKLPEKPTMTFKQYYNKRFLEEAKFFIENPKFSMKYMMVMAHLQKTIKEKALKEYQEKYPGYPADENEIFSNIEKPSNDKSSQTNTESVMSDYDIIDDTNLDLNNSDNSISCASPNSDVVEGTKTLRRSQRLQTKTF